MANNKTCRLNSILVEVFKLKIENQSFIKYLKLIFNKMLQENKIMKECKNNIIFTIFKSKPLYLPKNYKLITLMNIFFKIYIKINLKY